MFTHHLNSSTVGFCARRFSCVSGLVLLLLAWMLPSQSVLACGGFFCQTLPINQAAEQIIFRQDGDTTTAVVRILYQGDAEDFSWVVPVPARPELSTGSDQTFLELDFATRPLFDLEVRGQSCDAGGATTGGEGAPVFASPESTDDSVNVEELSVGPFAVQIVSSDNPDELALWLTDNGYDLSDNGRDLIAPYVNDGMQFVALKLRSGESAGSIQPLIMRYTNAKPTIPIRLTAVAAEEDMGVLVWIVGGARAVPENYLHVTPNYTRLNWYTGLNNAYASYQNLITAAMNEAGGQGFATDMAGRIDGNLLGNLSTAAPLEQWLLDSDGFTNDAEFITRLVSRSSNEGFLVQVRTALPLPDGQDDGPYFNFAALQTFFTEEELATARPIIRQAYLDIEINPLKESVAQIPDGEYITRLYTTLSADEMTLDPIFSYNADMGDQSALRQATMDMSCGENGTEWSLTLGPGTGREGETVIVANQPVPIAPPPEAAQQSSTWLIERTSGDAAPEVTLQNTFEVLAINTVVPTDVGDGDDDDGFLGAGGPGWLAVLLLAAGVRHRRSQAV